MVTVVERQVTFEAAHASGAGVKREVGLWIGRKFQTEQIVVI